MRILVGTSSLVGEGGIASYANQLIQYLCTNSYEVFVASPDLDSGQCDLPDTIVNTFHTPVGTNEADDRKTCSALLGFIDRSQPDVIINNDNHFISVLWPAIPQHIYRISVVHFPGGAIARDGVLNWHYVDRIVTISHAMCRIISRRYHIPSSRLKVVYNGIEPPVFEDESELFDKFKNGAPLQVVFFGGKSVRKGALLIPRFIRALEKRHVSVNFIWGGLEKDVDLNLPNKNVHISYLRKVDHFALLDLLRRSHVILMPSVGEGCPMLLLEAMALGVVPIVSDCPSAMREIVQTGVNGVVVPYEGWKQMASWIERLKADRDSLAQMARESRRMFLECLTMGHCVGQLLADIGNRDFRFPEPVPFERLGGFRWHRFKRIWTSYLPESIRNPVARMRDLLCAHGKI